jgi:pyoverdine/dityrosine biosynthesis protein Dit1
MSISTAPEFSMGGSGCEVSCVDVEQVVSEFLELFDSIRLVAPDDEYPGVGRHFLANVVRVLVEARRPIGLVLPAFPAKSPNVMKKVLGPLPGKLAHQAVLLVSRANRDFVS